VDDPLCSRLKATGNASAREELAIWSKSKGKELEGRAVAAGKVANWVIAIVQMVEPVRPKVKGLFEERPGAADGPDWERTA
jgi:hypothetical protein